jgi:hypothetical protein
MRIETDEQTTWTVLVVAFAVLLLTMIFQVRGCDQHLTGLRSERCKALIEANADPVTIYEVCNTRTK